MAQNSDTLQEPSMDELLASIREIIEENAGLPPQEGQMQGQNKDNAGRFSQNSASAAERPRGQEPAMQQMPHLKQDIRLRNVGNNGNNNAAMPPQNGYNSGGSNGIYPQGRNNNFAPGGFNGFAAGVSGNSAPPRDSRDANVREAAPMQDSMNALAERIGLRRHDTAARNETPGQARPADSGVDNNVAPPPSFMIPAAASGGRPNSHASGSYPAAGAVPFKNNGGSVNGGAPADGRFNPMAAPAGFRDSGHNRQESPRAADGKDGMAFAASMRQKASQERKADGRLPAGRITGEAGEYVTHAGVEKNMPADVEHSTENLLRPFIAQWLDEHFRGLFEKVLREEIQRFIRQSLRRES